MATRLRGFAVVGCVPAALFAAECAAYYNKRERLKKKKGSFLEGSTEWLLQNKLQTGDLVLTRKRLWTLGPLSALTTLVAQRAQAGCAYDTVGLVVVDRDGNPSVLEALGDGSCVRADAGLYGRRLA
jgi:hypothetical protein